MILVLVLSSCGFTQEGDLLREAVRTYGAQAYDEGLENAEFYICRAASVGSIVRRYGQDAKLFSAWRALCIGVDAPPFTPIPAPTSGLYEGIPPAQQDILGLSVAAGLEPFTNKGL